MALRRSREILGGVPVGNWGRIGGCEVSYRRYKGLRKNIGGAAGGIWGLTLGGSQCCPGARAMRGVWGASAPKNPSVSTAVPSSASTSVTSGPRLSASPACPGWGN